VYADTPVSQVLTSNAYEALYAAHGADSDFKGERDAVEMAKVWVEKFLKPGLTQQEQLEQALALLISTRRDRKQDLCYALIVGGYKSEWTVVRQSYFEFCWKRIQAKFDFFFSFTLRNPAAPGENPINRRYRWFISHVLGPDEFEQADRKLNNLLADAIYQRIQGEVPDAEGFYFPDSQYDNSKTLEKLENAVSSHLVFVQLVQRIMLVAPRDGDNYCFREYNRAVELLQDDPHKEMRVIFILAETDREAFKEQPVSPSYLEWRDHIYEKDPPYLAQAEFPNDALVKELNELIDNKVSPKIRAALTRLVEEAP
jgi:hypothetical protein